MEIAAPALGSGACASPMPTRSPRPVIQVSGFRKTCRSTSAVDDVWFEVYDAAGVLRSGSESLGGNDVLALDQATESPGSMSDRPATRVGDPAVRESTRMYTGLRPCIKRCSPSPCARTGRTALYEGLPEWEAASLALVAGEHAARKPVSVNA